MIVENRLCVTLRDKVIKILDSLFSEWIKSSKFED